MKKTIAQLENLFNDMRIQYVKKYAKEHNWNITHLCNKDLIGLYTCLEIKEKYEKTIDKYS